jgi:hypothetical protein
VTDDRATRPGTLFGDMSTTGESPFPYQPDAASAGQAPVPSRAGAVAATAGVLLGSAIIGLLGGVIWSGVAPRAAYVVISHGSADVINPETTAFIAGDACYCLIAVIGGLIIGIAGYGLAVRRYGPLPMAAVLVGSVVAGCAARWVGQNLGLANFNTLLLTSKLGTVLHAPPVLGAETSSILWPAIAFWPLAACVIPAGLMFYATWQDRQPSRRAQLR